MRRWYPSLLIVCLGVIILGYLVVKTPSPLVEIWRDMLNQGRQTRHSDLKSSEDVKDPKEVLQLRLRDQLRPLTDAEEGRTIQDLPNGIYAFSMCGVPSVKAKRDKTYLLEIHKHADGIVYYVGYASQDHIDKYFSRQKNFHIITSPHSLEKTPQLFEIPVDFVFKCEPRPFKETYVFDLFVTVIPELKE
jgi:hypothetical protein